MRINLGSVELSAEDRAAIGAYFGCAVATRQQCRQFVRDNGLGAVDRLLDPAEVGPEQVAAPETHVPARGSG